MPSWLIEEIVVLFIVGAVLVTIIAQLGQWRRAKIQSASDGELRTLVDRAIASQEAATTRLTEVGSQLEDMNRRVAAMERVLADAE